MNPNGPAHHALIAQSPRPIVRGAGAIADVAATKSRVKPAPPHPNPLQTELTGESGPARDGAYLAQRKASHDQALDVQKAYAVDGTAPALRSVASAIVPVVRQHVEMLKTM